MGNYTGRSVLSIAGHDKGSVLCVIGMDGEHLLLADGRRRKVQTPKRKKLKHIMIIKNAALYSGPMTNKALRVHLRTVARPDGQVST